MVRKEWIDRVGTFDETLRACEDWDMWLRLAYAGCRFGWVEHVAGRLSLPRQPDDAPIGKNADSISCCAGKVL